MKMSGHFNPVNKDETQYNRQLILTTNTLDQSVPMMSVKIFWFIVPREYNIVNVREEKKVNQINLYILSVCCKR